LSVERERTLQIAQSLADAEKFDRALEELQKVMQADPNDTRVLLKVGDLQVRARDYVGAISTYERVAEFYGERGFALKAVAVYKQVRELVQKHAAPRADHYGHVLERLIGLYGDLGLLTEALQALDEEATWLRSRDREQEAVVQYRRMVRLSPNNPVPHLRLAEGLCRVGQVEDAMRSFATAADQLLSAERQDDALRVMERMLHFKQDAKTAKLAARIYLSKGTQPEGMQALSRLQICFQEDPKDVETLLLLARAFEIIGQESKGFEVRKEIVRLAHEQGLGDVFRTTLAELQAQAPDDEQVRNLTQLPPPKKTGGPSAHFGAAPPSIPKAPANPRFEAASARPPQPSLDLETIEELEFLDDSSADAEVAPSGGPHITASYPDVGEELFEGASQPPTRASESDRASRPSDVSSSSAIPLRLQPSSVPPTTPRPLVPQGNRLPASGTAHSAPPSTRSLHTSGVPSDRGDPQAHTKRALADAAAFRGLRLLDKAIETVQVALEFDPQSIELRESLRDLYVERGDREAAIDEMLTMASIYIEYDHPDHAETVLMNVLEAVPDHPVALRTLSQINRQPVSIPPPSSRPAPELASPLPSFEQSKADDEAGSVEDALEQAEFFAARGLFEDALLILSDQLDRTPGNPLLLDSIQEIREAAAVDNGSQPPAPSPPPASTRPPPASQPAEPSPSTQASPDLRSRPSPKSTPSLREHGKTNPPSSSASSRSVPKSQTPPPSGDRLPPSSRHRTAVPNPASEGNRSDFDLKSQLGELERAVRESQKPPSAGKHKKKPTVDVDKVFEKFKTRVRSQVAENDSSTHYDLGVAYKEMRLYDDSIEALRLAAHEASLECNCYSMIGLIYAEQEKWEDATKALTRALGAATKTTAQEANLYYDLGHAYEKLGRDDRAAYHFQQALRRDASFRDTKDRVANLRKRSQPPSGAPGPSDDELDRAFEELLGD
jgi:tetratricopeptide (TPR) repeat protein